MYDTNLTTEGDLDFDSEIKENMIKLDKLTTENEALQKQLREKEHNSSQVINELKMENEKLIRINKNTESLLETLKANQAKEELEDVNFETEIAKRDDQITELENKLFLDEQTELTLKRQIQQQTVEISNLKIELDKQLLKLSTDSSHNNNLNSDIDNTLDNMDENTKHLVTELMNEIEDLKKEKNEIQEKALTLITEKEINFMILQEEMDNLKDEHQKELTELYNKVTELEFKDEEGEASVNSDTKIAKYQYDELLKEFDYFKLEANEKEDKYVYENERLKNEVYNQELNFRNSIQELEMEITKLKHEIQSHEHDRFELEREMAKDSDNKDVLFNELENYQNQIRSLDEQKSELINKHHIQEEKMRKEINENDKLIKSLQKSLKDLETENSNLKAQNLNTLKENLEKSKLEITALQKEIISLKEKNTNNEKEKETLRKDAETARKNFDKNKADFKELNEQMRKIKENYDIDSKRQEDKYTNHVNRLESERERLTDQIHNLTNQINKTESNDLESIITQETTKTTINHFEEKYNQSVKELATAVNEIGILQKEIAKSKQDYIELKQLTQTQIDKLQEQTLKNNAKISMTVKRRSTKGSLKADNMNLTAQQIQILAELEGTISKLSAENKYNIEKIEILNLEIANLKILREKDIKFLKEEITAAEDQAIHAKVAYATLAFDKDCEIIKYKNYAKKLRIKLGIIPAPNQNNLNRTQTLTKK